MKWTKLNKRLPPGGAYVLLGHTKSPTGAEFSWVQQGVYVSSGAGAFFDPVSGNRVKFAMEPTHWMPLPDGPA
jgi:hypothetical protein